MNKITDSHQIFKRLYPDMPVQSNPTSFDVYIMDKNTKKMVVLEYIPIYDERAIPNIPTEELVFCKCCQESHCLNEPVVKYGKLSEDEIQSEIKKMELFIQELVMRLKKP